MNRFLSIILMEIISMQFATYEGVGQIELDQDMQPIATTWVMNAIGDSGKIAVKSVYLVKSERTGMKGTGFLFKDGVIITNEHVVRGSNPEHIVLVASTGKEIKISEIVSDTTRDLAALYPTQTLSGGLELAEKADVKIGDVVWTWGYPLGYNGPAPLLSVGYLSGFKEYSKKDKPDIKLKNLVVNGAFNPGNSGGPLFEANQNKVIGVVVSKALPLFTPRVASIIKAFEENRYGMQYKVTDDNGNWIEISEAQLVAEIVKSLRDMSQAMIGEAISLEDLKSFLKEAKITTN